MSASCDGEEASPRPESMEMSADKLRLLSSPWASPRALEAWSGGDPDSSRGTSPDSASTGAGAMDSSCSRISSRGACNGTPEPS